MKKNSDICSLFHKSFSKRLNTLIIFSLLTLLHLSVAQSCELTIARLRYGGGGDWYTGPSMLPNLVSAARNRTDLPICDTSVVVQISDRNFFHHPFIFMTGHGEVRFTPEERLRLRKYLIGGGFLWADDNYGMDASLRREIASLFPENPLVEIPSDHPIYSSFYELPGLPKIHEHDGEPAQGFGVFFEGRMVLYYSYSADIGNGMEDLRVHNVGEKLHEKALRMGVNVVYWFFKGEGSTRN
ncbi:hypothetical protein CHISP_2279 [Chitinispirillum alkaliphilum]|nr:hypothetical protein CHISP_2279 [Chitinispirillum alkaliphilum]